MAVSRMRNKNMQYNPYSMAELYRNSSVIVDLASWLWGKYNVPQNVFV